MNARTLLLLVVALTLGGGLAYVLLGDPAKPARTEGPLVSDRDLAPRQVQPQDDPTPRAATIARAELSGLSGNWQILPGGPKGERLPKSRISARRDNDTRSATGQASFTGLEPGDWELTVEAEGLPTWRGTVTVAGAGKPTLTTPRLSNDIRVTGTIVDQRGEPVGGVNLWLVPDGTSHPIDGKGAQELTSAVSTSDGRFRLDARAAGTWRLTVGKPAQEARFASERFELELGRERVVRVVVPARARLTVEAPPDDFNGATVLAVLAQREAPAVDPNSFTEGELTETDGGRRRMTAEEAEAIKKKRAELGPGVDKLGLKDSDIEGQALEDQATDALKAAELLAPEHQARMKEAEERAARERNRRARLIDEGWSTVRSARFEQGQVGEVPELPEGKNLRFVLYRGSEGFTISESVVAPEGALVKLTVMPPPPFPADMELPEVPRAAGSRLVVEPIGATALPVGLVFER